MEKYLELLEYVVIVVFLVVCWLGLSALLG